jgi:hypothetical protein
MAAQTLMTAAPLVTAWPDLIFGGLPKPRPIASRQGHLPQECIWTSRYSIDRPVGPRRRSRPQILVALHSRAKVNGPSTYPALYGESTKMSIPR